MQPYLMNVINGRFHSQIASLGTIASETTSSLNTKLTDPLCAQQLAELSVLLCVPVSFGREASAHWVWALLLATGPAAGERSIVGRGKGCRADPCRPPNPGDAQLA